MFLEHDLIVFLNHVTCEMQHDKLDLYAWAKLEWKMYTEIWESLFKDAPLCFYVLASGISGVENTP